MARETYDAVIIGAGHNGLTCAGYLARAGLSVKVVEARHVVGGAAVTEEFWPGFRNSICSYSVSLLNPKIIRDLELEKYGLKIVLRNSAGFVPLESGDCMYLPRDGAGKKRELDRLAPGDGAAYARFEREIEDVAMVLRALMLRTPPELGGGMRDLVEAALAGNAVRKLDPHARGVLAKLMTMSVGHYLEEYFAGDPIKGLYGYNGVVGNMQSPYAPGSAYVLLHHNFGEVNGMVGAWGHAMGGMGAITQAMARSAQAHGAEIAVSSPVKEVITEGGHARGVVLASGEAVRARIVVANCNPKILFQKLVDTALLDPAFKREIDAFRCRSGTLRMNVALSALPDFLCRPGTALQEHHTASLIIAPSLDYLEAAYDDAKMGGWSRRPVIEMNINSTIDDTLAPRGAHVASVFCQHFHPELSGGRDWDDVKGAAADAVIDTIARYAPNFRQALIGYQVLSPKDLERDFGLVGGDIFHGALHLDQIYSLRPAPGAAAYRMPVPGLYLCGSGAHPGGGVSGIPGHNAAREILKDFKGGRIARNRRSAA